MIALDDVLVKLQRVKRTGSSYMALCPSHDDKEPSLSLKVGDDGRPLANCHAGCSFADIMGAIGIDVKDTLPERDRVLTLGDAVTVYDYHDEAGALLFKVGRFVPKSFRPFYLEGRSWRMGQGNARRVPFRLPQIIEAVAKGKPVYVVEGEKDALNLEKLGIVATTNPSGAEKWLQDWNAYFVDARVAILPDNDEAGAKHADKVARTLNEVAKEIRVVNLPGLSAHGDVTDWLNQGHGAQELRELVKRAPTWNPNRPLLAGLDVVTLSTVKAARVRWLWPDYLPLGKLATLEGDPGLGKSTITLDLAARLTTGSEMPDGTPMDEPHSVLLFTSEDDLADTIVPRLQAAGADLTRIHSVGAIKIDDTTRGLQIPEDIYRMEEMITTYGISLAVIDPLVAFLGPDIDSHRDQDARRALFPLKELAARTGACILLMRHLNKSSGSAIYRGGGSIGITAQVRLGMVVAQDHDNKAMHYLAVYKSNLARKGETLSYRLVPADLLGVGKIKWTGPSDKTADDILAPPKRRRTKTEQAWDE